jgi:hypothetical protein
LSTPPDLDLPFANDRERARALAAFLENCGAIETWVEYAASPTTIPAEVRKTLELSIEPGDALELKLRRWANLFADEIRAVLDARSRVIHGMGLGDKELRGATWLANHLLGLVQEQGGT